MDYCIYLTVYRGARLPKRYVGSSTVSRVLNGYNGTIRSRKYASIFREEQQSNKHLFKTRILKRFATAKEALIAERELQLKYDVVKSPNYMNMAIAMPNGFFGRGVSGENHPRWGKRHTEDTNRKISSSLKKAYEEGRAACPFAHLDYNGKNNPFYGRKHSASSIEKMRKPKSFVPKWKCPHCDKQYDAGNLDQHLKRTLGWEKQEAQLYRATNQPANTQ